MCGVCGVRFVVFVLCSRVTCICCAYVCTCVREKEVISMNGLSIVFNWSLKFYVILYYFIRHYPALILFYSS